MMRRCLVYIIFELIGAALAAVAFKVRGKLLENTHDMTHKHIYIYIYIYIYTYTHIIVICYNIGIIVTHK